MMYAAKISILPILSFFIFSCGKTPEPAATKPAATEKSASPAKGADHGGLQDQPMDVPADNPITPEKVALGKQLFFDSRLSKTGKMSCESCHHPEHSWTSGTPFTAKFDGSMNTRTTPTLNNVGYLRLWYWDGRGKTLEGVALTAWQKQMGADPDQIAMKLNDIAGYKDEFQKAMGGPASGDSIAKALATFMRTIKSDNSAWDRCEQGEKSAACDELSKGFDIFSHQNKGNCTLCHLPPLYTDTLFHNIGVEAGKTKPDPGRGKIMMDEKEDTNKAADMMGAFKTPTLRGVADAAPYFHDARSPNLEKAVLYMLGGGTENPNLDPKLKKRGINKKEFDQLIAFITSLTPERKPYEKPTLP